MELIQNCTISKATCCNKLSYIVAFPGYSIGLSNVILSGLLIVSALVLCVRVKLARGVPVRRGRVGSADLLDPLLPGNADLSPPPPPPPSSSQYLRLGGDSRSRPLLKPYGVVCLWIGAWFGFRAITYALPAGDFAKAMGYCVFFSRAILDNTLIVVGFSLAKQVTVRSFVVAWFVGAALALAKTSVLLIATFSDTPCTWCPIWMGSVSVQWAYWVFAASYLIWCAVVICVTPRRFRTWPWIIFISFVHLVDAVGVTLWFAGIDVGLCMVVAVEVLIAVLYGLVAFQVAARDSINVLVAHQQPRSEDMYDPDDSAAGHPRDRPLSDAASSVSTTTGQSPPPSPSSSSAASQMVAPIINEHSLQLIPYSDLRFDRVIGSGGFGEVYRGRWKGQAVALKKLLASSRGDALHEFIKELAVLAKLRHHNIVQLYGVCCERADQYLVLEFCEKGSVFDYIHHGSQTIGWPFARRIALDAARGMSYLHSFDPPILHRDLKSQNLILDADLVAKICDFGLSRVKSISATMSRIGTVQWVAPEVLREERYSEKADVWSYGVIIWELASKQIPFEGIPAIRIASNVAFKNWKLPIPSDTPPDLAQVMRNCWKSADSRPSFQTIVANLN